MQPAKIGATCKSIDFNGRVGYSVFVDRQKNTNPEGETMSRRITVDWNGGEKTLDLLVPKCGVHDTIMMMKDLQGWEIQVALFHCAVAKIGLNRKDLPILREDEFNFLLSQTEKFVIGELSQEEFYKVRQRLLDIGGNKRLSWPKRGRLKHRAVRSAVLNLERAYDYRIDLLSSCYNMVAQSLQTRREVDFDKRPAFLFQVELGKMCNLSGIYGRTNRRLTKEPDFSMRLICEERLKHLKRAALGEQKLAILEAGERSAKEDAARILKGFQEQQEFKKTFDNKNDL